MMKRWKHSFGAVGMAFLLMLSITACACTSTKTTEPTTTEKATQVTDADTSEVVETTTVGDLETTEPEITGEGQVEETEPEGTTTEEDTTQAADTSVTQTTTAETTTAATSAAATSAAATSAAATSAAATSAAATSAAATSAVATSAVATSAATTAAQTTTAQETTASKSDVDPMNTSISSVKMVKNMKTGWNLGNAFDATDCTWLTNELGYESAWCGAKTTNQLIDAVYSAGFKTIRIPVSWHNHLDSKGKISSVWMNRVKEVVDYCYNKGMYVILDVHHDVASDYYYPTNDKLTQSTNYLKNVWTQIANTFKNYNERLIFEGINEPRMVGHGYEWWYNASDTDCQNALKCIVKLNQVFVDTVRATGGNNANRFLMVGGYDTDYANTVTSFFFYADGYGKGQTDSDGAYVL